MQEDCKSQPHNRMPTAEQRNLKRVMAFPSNPFVPHIECKHQSNVVLNQEAYSEDLRLPSSGCSQPLRTALPIIPIMTFADGAFAAFHIVRG